MNKHLLAAAALGASLVAMPVFSADTWFKFDDGIGSQPFRNTANAPAPNLVAGVAPGGAPWVIKSLKAEIRSDGKIIASGKGLLLGGGDNTGARGGPRRVVASLFCRDPFTAPATAGALQTAPYNSAFVDLDADGDFKIDSFITNASAGIPPENCGDKIDNRPVLLIRTVAAATATTPAAPGAWFAAGILKGKTDDKDSGKN